MIDTMTGGAASKAAAEKKAELAKAGLAAAQVAASAGAAKASSAPEVPARATLGQAGPDVQTPKYKMVTKAGDEGQCLVVTISLPDLADGGMRDVALDINDGEMELQAQASTGQGLYKLKFDWPQVVSSESAAAKFSKKKKELTITVPCK
jgi:hypothetical protein